MNLVAALAFAAWSLNDVSVLLPLPLHATDPALLAPETTGAGGVLLPPDLLRMMPTLMPQDDGAIDRLRVVAVRLDPCFPKLDPMPPATCRPQVRLVWQPLNDSFAGAAADDAGLHSFYELTPAEFQALKAAWPVAAELEGQPLAVHPTIKTEGLGGPTWTALRKLVLQYAGTSRLSRVTFMATLETASMWDFGGFDVKGATVTRVLVPRVNTRAQSFINRDTASFRGGPRPGAEGDDTFTKLMSDSAHVTAADAALLRTSADAVHKIENPSYFSAETADCVSCHAAQPARLWAVQHFPGLGLDDSPYRYTSTFPMTNVSPLADQPTLLRAFGYLGRQVAISQRTIHESAAVAAALNRP